MEYNHRDEVCGAKCGIRSLERAESGLDRRKASDPWDQSSRPSCAVSSSLEAVFRRFLAQLPFPGLWAFPEEAGEAPEGAYALKGTRHHLGYPKAVCLELKGWRLCLP